MCWTESILQQFFFFNIFHKHCNQNDYSVRGANIISWEIIIWTRIVIFPVCFNILLRSTWFSITSSHRDTTAALFWKILIFLWVAAVIGSRVHLAIFPSVSTPFEAKATTVVCNMWKRMKEEGSEGLARFWGQLHIQGLGLKTYFYQSSYRLLPYEILITKYQNIHESLVSH